MRQGGAGVVVATAIEGTTPIAHGSLTHYLLGNKHALSTVKGDADNAFNEQHGCGHDEPGRLAVGAPGGAAVVLLWIYGAGRLLLDVGVWVRGAAAGVPGVRPLPGAERPGHLAAAGIGRVRSAL